MFNTTILDVAIGMIFIYLLLSLMCTAANEIIELLLKKRAIDLERGIRELLVPGSASGNRDIVSEFYNHPLINNLFGGRYEDSRIASKVRWVVRTALPSYIPARNFSLALMDIIRPGVVPGGAAGTQSGTTGATAPSLSPASPAQVVVNVAGGVAPAVVPPPPPITNPALVALRTALLANPQLTDQIRQGLVPLLDAAGNDIARVRENIEGWYNASMDRVSSWYKRRAQVTTLIIGLFIAVTVNVDTIKIAKRLSTDRPLREAMVAAAIERAKESASATPTPTPPPTLSPGAIKPATNTTSPTPTPTPTPAPTLTPTPASGSSSTGGQTSATPTPTPLPACKKDPTSAECRYQESLAELQTLGLPLGWDSTDDIGRQWPGWHWKRDGGWWDQIYWHLFGWLLTALAISLGAPFWFDLLNKFIVIRSAVKPHEKSPEEGSKD